MKTNAGYGTMCAVGLSFTHIVKAGIPIDDQRINDTIERYRVDGFTRCRFTADAKGYVKEMSFEREYGPDKLTAREQRLGVSRGMSGPFM